MKPYKPPWSSYNCLKKPEIPSLTLASVYTHYPSWSCWGLDSLMDIGNLVKKISFLSPSLHDNKIGFCLQKISSKPINLLYFSKALHLKCTSCSNRDPSLLSLLNLLQVSCYNSHTGVILPESPQSSLTFLLE